jgi:hypothetical protein
MNLEKADVKIGTANEIGCQIEDSLEAAQKEALRAEGTLAAFPQVQQTLEGVFKAVDKDIEAGDFDLDTAALIKKYLVRAAQAIQTLSKQSEANRLVLGGKIVALEHTVKLVSAYKQAEELKASNFRKAVEAQQQEAVQSGQKEETVAGRPQELNRPAGMHPGVSVKARRQAQKATESVSIPATKQDTVSEQDSPQKAAPKVRGARRANRVADAEPISRRSR